jgi:hypothetical protein
MVVTPALAGPPLLCHPYEIENARSLPWDQSRGWSGERPEYDVGQLIADTEALLTPSTPVIVRMETLRRASLYASRDASRLLSQLVARAEAADARRRPDALALLDAAYIAGAYRQISMLDGHFRDRAAAARDALGNVDAYALIERSIAAKPDDPSLQFAAAMITADGDRSASLRHAEKARAGVTTDGLLARNINRVL